MQSFAPTPRLQLSAYWEIALTVTDCKAILLNGSTALNRTSLIAGLVQPNPNATTFYEAFPDELKLDALINDMGYELTTEEKEKLKFDFRNTDRQVRTRLAFSVHHSSYSDELINISNSNIPVAIVGEKDKFCQTNFLDNSLPNKWKNKTFLIKNSGHCSQLDQPIMFSNIIADFAKTCFNT